MTTRRGDEWREACAMLRVVALCLVLVTIGTLLGYRIGRDHGWERGYVDCAREMRR